MNTWPSRQDHYPAEKRAFDKNPLHTSYDDLDYMDSKHFSRIVWWQLGALVFVGLVCALCLFWLGVVIVNFFLQTKVETVTGIVILSVGLFALGVSLIISAKV